MALCIEAGGRLNEQFLKLIDYFASVCGSTESERRAFTVFALQRIYLASQRGVARLFELMSPFLMGLAFCRLVAFFSFEYFQWPPRRSAIDEAE